MPLLNHPFSKKGQDNSSGDLIESTIQIGQQSDLVDPSVLSITPSRVVPSMILNEDVWVCDNCQALNQPNVQFCGQCGSQIGKTCPSCEKFTKMEDSICRICRVDIDEFLEEKERLLLIAAKKEERLCLIRLKVENQDHIQQLRREILKNETILRRRVFLSQQKFNNRQAISQLRLELHGASDVGNSYLDVYLSGYILVFVTLLATLASFQYLRSLPLGLILISDIILSFFLTSKFIIPWYYRSLLKEELQKKRREIKGQQENIKKRLGEITEYQRKIDELERYVGPVTDS